MLNLVRGIDKPSGGEIRIASERVDTLSSGQLAKWRERHAGFIFQFYNLMPMLTAEKNVVPPLLLTSQSSAQRKQNVDTALALVSLSDRAKHNPTELSGDQQHRVATVCATIADPTILTCDESTGDLDRQTAEEILRLLQILNREQKKSIIIVTHEPKAADHASRLLHVDKGQLVDGMQSAA